jgi:hypothetical protein
MKAMTVSRSALFVAAFAVLALAAAAVRPSAQTAPRSAPTRTVYASVVGKDDVPVAGLTAADFTVREDGTPREVLSVKPGGAPAHIALLIDDSQALTDESAVQDYRAALTTFVKDTLAASPTTDIALVSFANRPTQLIDYTSSAVALQKVIDRIFGQQNAGAYMLTAIADTCKGLKKKSYTGAAIVAFTMESGPEFGPESHQAIEDALKGTGSSLWTIVLPGRQRQRADNESEERERAIVLGDTAEKSGGMRDMVMSRIGLEPRFKALAARLAARYAITYGRPEALIPPERLEITVARKDARVLISRWAGQ